jgi:hypothetical protein
MITLKPPWLRIKKRRIAKDDTYLLLNHLQGAAERSFPITQICT